METLKIIGLVPEENQSKDVDEKENKVGDSSTTGSTNIENVSKTPSALIVRTFNNDAKNDFGPLSPVQLNVSNNRANKERNLSKKKSVGAKQTKTKDDSYSLEEGNSLYSEVATFAAAEEEEQLKKIMDDHNTSMLNHSEKLVGFLEGLEGSIRTALQQNKQTADGPTMSTIEETEMNVNENEDNIASIGGKLAPVVETSLEEDEAEASSSEHPNAKRISNGINNFVGDLIGKLGSLNPSPVNDDDTPSDSNPQLKKGELELDSSDALNVTPVSVEDASSPSDASIEDSIDEEQDNIEESPVLKPKSKYWESLMLKSEEPRDTRYDFCDSPSDASEMATEKTDDKTHQKNEDNTNISIDDIPSTRKTPMVNRKTFGLREALNKEEESSPQSLISIPDDYSPGDGGFGNTPYEKGPQNRCDNSPGSLMFNMISAATNIETPLVCKSRLSVGGKTSIIDTSPGLSEFRKMIASSATIETPNVDGKTSIIDTSPGLSEFRKMIASSTTTETPNVGDSIRSRPSLMEVDESYIPLKSKSSNDNVSEKYVDNLLDSTPVKSNKTEVFRRGASESSLQSNCDVSEDGSIYTSLSLQSTIQSNTPRSRKVAEWLDPSASNAVSWPVPSMNTNLKSSETPERQLPVTKMNSKSKTMDTKQYSNAEKKPRAKPKSLQVSDWRSHRLKGSSPTSLPSLLGGASCNEVSDLESPNIVNFPLNFKFSDEESTIQSQSVNEANEMHSIPDCIPRLTSPHSLMTVATPTVGCPSDEECSYGRNPKNGVKTYNPTASPDTLSIRTSRDDDSPLSMMPNRPFRRFFADDKISKHSVCLTWCIAIGMLIAIGGASTVIGTVYHNPTQEEQPINIDKDFSPSLNIDVAAPTESPTFDTTSIPSWNPESVPTNNPTTRLRPVSTKPPLSKATPMPSFKPILDPASEDSENSTTTSEPTMKPTRRSTPIADSSPSASPTVQLVPTLVPELDIDPSFKPTARPTFKPNNIPTFSKEQIQELTWDSIMHGDDVWGNSDGENIEIPLWYFADDDEPGIKLRIINAAKGDRYAKQLQIAVDDYRRSKAVSAIDFNTVPYEVLCAPPRLGEIKVCSGDYGDNDWIGSTILFMRDEYVVGALIRINESSLTLASDTILQYAMCNQLGHTLGLVHDDTNLDLSSCLKDFGANAIENGNLIRNNEKLQHPNSDDLDYLVTLYGSASSRLLRGR